MGATCENITAWTAWMDGAFSRLFSVIVAKSAEVRGSRQIKKVTTYVMGFRHKHDSASAVPTAEMSWWGGQKSELGGLAEGAKQSEIVQPDRRLILTDKR